MSRRDRRMTEATGCPHLAQAEDPNQPGGGSTGGGGDWVGYHLGELERRVGNLEESVSDIQQIVSAIREQMKSVATKHTVSFWIVGVVIVNFLTLVGHLLIGSLSGG